MHSRFIQKPESPNSQNFHLIVCMIRGALKLKFFMFYISILDNISRKLNIRTTFIRAIL